MLSQTTDTEQTDDTLFIDVVQKQGQTEVKTDECFSTLHVQGTLGLNHGKFIRQF